MTKSVPISPKLKSRDYLLEAIREIEVVDVVAYAQKYYPHLVAELQQTEIIDVSHTDKYNDLISEFDIPKGVAKKVVILNQIAEAKEHLLPGVDVEQEETIVRVIAMSNMQYDLEKGGYTHSQAQKIVDYMLQNSSNFNDAGRERMLSWAMFTNRYLHSVGIVLGLLVLLVPIYLLIDSLRPGSPNLSGIMIIVLSQALVFFGLEIFRSHRVYIGFSDWFQKNVGKGGRHGKQ